MYAKESVNLPLKRTQRNRIFWFEITAKKLCTTSALMYLVSPSVIKSFKPYLKISYISENLFLSYKNEYVIICVT